MDVNTKVEVDLIKFLEIVIEGIENDYEFAYPLNSLDSNNAHTSLQSIKGRVRSLKAFIKATKQKPADEN